MIGRCPQRLGVEFPWRAFPVGITAIELTGAGGCSQAEADQPYCRDDCYEVFFHGYCCFVFVSITPTGLKRSLLRVGLTKSLASLAEEDLSGGIVVD